MQPKTLSRRTLIILLAIVVIGLFIAAIILSLDRTGKTRVDIQVIPTDASVTIDGSEASAGVTYLKPGTHTFLATKDGFAAYKRIVVVTSEPVSVGLIPEPISPEAQKMTIYNNEVQARREALAGNNANLAGQTVEDRNPIVKLLPYIDINGPFAIDYGIINSSEGKIFLEINDSSPEGRVAALKWIKEHGFNLAEFDIRFNDFSNPLAEVESTHE